MIFFPINLKVTSGTAKNPHFWRLFAHLFMWSHTRRPVKLL